DCCLILFAFVHGGVCVGVCVCVCVCVCVGGWGGCCACRVGGAGVVVWWCVCCWVVCVCRCVCVCLWCVSVLPLHRSNVTLVENEILCSYLTSDLHIVFVGLKLKDPFLNIFFSLLFLSFSVARLIVVHR